MSDVVKEQMVKRHGNSTDTFKRVGIVLAALVLCYIIIDLIAYVPGIAEFVLFLIAIVLFAAYWTFGQLKKEFEYTFVNGDLDVDCIYNRSRRRRVFSGDVKKIVRMVHVDEHGYDGDFRNAKIRDCSTGVKGPNTYRFAASFRGKQLCVIFEPDDELLAKMTPYLGQKKFVKRR